MAKKLHSEQISLDIIINGNKAQKEIYDLEKDNRGLTSTIKELRLAQTRLRAEGEKGSMAYKSLTAEIKKKTNALNLNKAKIIELQKELGITGLTMAQLSKRSKELKLALRQMLPGSAKYKELQAELQAVNHRMAELNNKARQHKMSFSTAANWLNKYQTLLLSITATLTGVVFSLQNFLDYSGELSDQMSNVRKTTGLTEEQIKSFSAELGGITTRTSKMELLQLAEEAGRLGIEGSENIRSFVKEANKIKVALGDDLSDEAIREVGKMVNVYKVGEDTGKNFAGAMDALGSAINAVSASGANQAGYLVDYIKRQAGVASQAKISAADNIAYAATFDEIGQSVEVSATAMNKVWMDMFKNPSEYAKIAGVSIQDFNQILEKDSNKAMLMFLKGLKGNEKGFAKMLDKMKDLEVGGARGVQALAALVDNTELLTEKQKIANQSLEDATSLTEEYNLKNENLAGLLSIIKKKIIATFSSSTIIEWLENAVRNFAIFIGVVKDTEGSITKWRKVLVFTAKIITIVITSILSYTAASKLMAIWTARNTYNSLLFNVQLKIMAVRLYLLEIKTKAAALAQALLTRNTAGVASAFRALRVAIMANPIGLLIAVVTAITTAYVLFNDEVDKSIQKQKTLSDINAEVTNSVKKETKQLNALLKVARDENQSKENRIKAIKQLNRLSPEYLGNLSLETIKTKEADKAVRDYIRSLQSAARTKAINKRMDMVEDKRAELRVKKTDDLSNFGSFGTKVESFMNNDLGGKDLKKNANLEKLNQILYNSKGKYKGDLEKFRKEVLKDYLPNVVEAFENYSEQMQEINKEGKIIEGLLEQDIKLNPNNYFEETSDSSVSSDKSSKSYKKNTKTSNSNSAKNNIAEKRKKELEELRRINQKYQDDLERLRKEANQNMLDQMEDGFDKELTTLQLNSSEKIKEHKKELIAQAYISQLTIERDKAIKAGLKEKANEITSIIENAQIKNEEINSLILQEDIIFQNKKRELNLKFSKEKINDLNADYEKQKAKRLLEFNENLLEINSIEDAKLNLKGNYTQKELEQINTWEKAKAALRKEHDLKELEEQEIFLKQLLSKLAESFNEGEFEGFNLDGMTDQQKQVFLDYLEALKQKLVEVGLAKKDIANSELGNESETSGDTASYGGGNTDILGMNPEQWTSLFENLEKGKLGFQEITAVVGAVQNAFSKYYEFINASEKKNLQTHENATNRKKQNLKKQLDEGYISQESYENQIEKLDLKLDRKKAEMAHKQAKREKEMAIVSAIMGTANAIVGMLSSKPVGPWNFALSGIAGVMGALHIATIAKQQLPAKGYELGLYPDDLPVKRQQDGKIFNAKYGGDSKTGMVNEPTLFLAGEHSKPEMIIHNDALKRFSPDLKNLLYKELAEVRGFENGYYAKQESTSSTESNELLLQMVLKNNQLLDKILKEGIEAHMRPSAKNGEQLIKAQDKFKDLKNKSIQ